VNVAQVPDTYHVPALMIHPSVPPLYNTGSVPLPEALPPVGLPPEPVVVVVVVVVTGLPDLGSHLMPVAGQLVVSPTAVVGTNEPVCRDPCTLKV
jgi:hypothetical protein